MNDHVEDRYIWSFSIEWTERVPYPGFDPPWRTIGKGESQSYSTEAKAMEQRQWHLNNMGSWTPETAIDAFVSDVGRRTIGVKVVNEQAS